MYRWLVDSGSWSSVGVAGRDVVLADCGEHGGVVDAEVLADSGEGPAEVVEVDGVIDLVGG